MHTHTHSSHTVVGHSSCTTPCGAAEDGRSGSEEEEEEEGVAYGELEQARIDAERRKDQRIAEQDRREQLAASIREVDERASFQQLDAA